MTRLICFDLVQLQDYHPYSETRPQTSTTRSRLSVSVLRRGRRFSPLKALKARRTPLSRLRHRLGLLRPTVHRRSPLVRRSRPLLILPQLFLPPNYYQLQLSTEKLRLRAASERGLDPRLPQRLGVLYPRSRRKTGTGTGNGRNWRNCWFAGSRRRIRAPALALRV